MKKVIIQVTSGRGPVECSRVVAKVQQLLKMIFNFFSKRKTVKQRLIESINPNDKIQILLGFVSSYRKNVYGPSYIPFYYKIVPDDSSRTHVSPWDFGPSLGYRVERVEKTYDTFPTEWNEEKFIDYLSNSNIKFNSFSFGNYQYNPRIDCVNSQTIIRKIINNWIENNPLFSMEKIYSLLEQNDVPYSKISHNYHRMGHLTQWGEDYDTNYKRDGIIIEATDINSNFLKSLINLAWTESNGVQWCKKRGFYIN